MGRGRIVVRDVRDRRDRPADPVPARVRIAVGGSAVRRRRPARRRRCRRPVHHAGRSGSASLRQLAFGAIAIAATYRRRDPRRYSPMCAFCGRALACAWCCRRLQLRTRVTSTAASTYLGQVGSAAGYRFDDTTVGGLSAAQLRPGQPGVLRHQRRPRRRRTLRGSTPSRITLSDNSIDGVDSARRHPLLDADGAPFPPLYADARPPVATGPRGHRLRRAPPAAVLVQRGRADHRRPQRPAAARPVGAHRRASTAATAASSRCRRCCTCRQADAGPGRTWRWRA